MTSRFLPVLEVSRNREGGIDMTSRFLLVLKVSRNEERRFWYDQ
jgi:hypothetical protein